MMTSKERKAFLKLARVQGHLIAIINELIPNMPDKDKAATAGARLREAINEVNNSLDLVDEEWTGGQ